jgi:subfamily B ATP-binding cassette protein MsbA
MMIEEFKAVVQALLPLLRLYPWSFVAIIVLGLLSSLAEGVGISLFIPFLQSINQTSYHLDSGNWLVGSLWKFFNNIPSERRLFIISLCIFGSILTKAILSYSYGVLCSWLEVRVGHQLRSGIFEQLLTVSYGFLQRSQSGNLLNTLATETWRSSQALSVLVDLAITVCLLVVYVALLLLISWPLTLLVAGFMLLVSVVTWRLTQRVQSLGKKATRTNAALTGRMLEGLTGMKVIRSFGQELYEKQRFDRTSEQLRNVMLQLNILRGIVTPVHEILAGLLLVSILLMTLRSYENLPALMVFIFVLYRLQPRIKSLDGARVNLSSLRAAIEEVISLLDRADKPYILSGATPYQGLKQGIYFEGVTLYYDATEKPALRDVSLCIPAGKTTALVGPSGAGKSTLIDLIFRFYEPSAGEIYIDDHPLPALDLATWRRRVAMVSQDVYLFNTTVWNNIAYGRPQATRDEIVAAAKLADAHNFISQLPQGYSTKVGDRGVRLSGGQQQRLTLARAITHNPEILILDEATNALDSISENLIQEALDTLSHNRTVIVIAHRLSTIEQADHIIVLEEGSVREQGDFQCLVRYGGLFTKLYSLQYRRALNDGT